MAQFTAILSALGTEKFTTLLGATSRQARESYFARHAIKAPKVVGLPRPGQKNALRAAALYQALCAEPDEEVAQEILRSWLLGRRPMLAAALDHMGIPHKDGLTESDEVSKIAKLPAAQRAALHAVLVDHAAPWEVDAYLEFLAASAA